MVARIAQLALDVLDLERQATFWSEALGMSADTSGKGGMLFPPEGAPKSAQTIYLQPVEEGKRDKMRLHFDLRPEDGDTEAEVERLLRLGATRADVGQTGDEGFTVLADPEGNEFCVLHEDPR
jgi:predicted enzyme related to lactoylglutathione lyase